MTCHSQVLIHTFAKRLLLAVFGMLHALKMPPLSAIEGAAAADAVFIEVVGRYYAPLLRRNAGGLR